MRHFFVLILLLITSALKAQVSYQLLSETEGLPTKEIYQVYIDSKGYLWIGHAMGISRYNGNRFTHYNNPQQNSLGISNIVEDAKGRIWCRNFGSQIFYIENNQMHLLEAYDWKTQFNFPCIALDNNGNLLANHRNGVFVYNIEHKTAEIIKPEDNTPIGFQINTIAKLTPDNILIFIIGEQLYAYKNKKLKPLFFQSKYNESIYRYSKPTPTPKDTLYLLNAQRDSALACVVKNDTCKEVRRFKILQGTYDIIQLNNKQVWILGKTGAVNLSDSKQTITNLSVSFLANDNNGNIWFSTLQSGIGYFSDTKYFRQLANFNLNQSGIIQSLVVYKNQLVVSTNLGNVYFIHHNSIHNKINLPQNKFMSTLHVYNENLYGGGLTLSKYNNEKNSFENMYEISFIKEITTDNQGYFYTANTYTLLKFKPSTTPIFLRYKRCKSVKWIEKSNTIYAAFTDGIYTYKNNKETELTINGKSIYATTLTSFADTLVAATVNDGIYFFVNDTMVYHLNKESGLPSNQITRIKYYLGKLWVQSSQDIIAIETANFNITNYTYYNLLPPNAITDFTIWNNELIIAGAGKIYAIDITKRAHKDKPNLYLDAVKINGKDSVLNSGWSVPYKMNNINFILNGVSIQSSKNLSYQYRLIGIDTNWQTISSNQYQIDYPTLPSGKYEFQAIAISTSGYASEILSHKFQIQKPWWQELWFYFLLSAVLVSAAFILFKWRLSIVKRKNDFELERLNLQSDLRQSMLSAIKSQMNPHFIFNALNTIQSYIYTSDENKASNYLGKFSDLIRLILDNSQKKLITLHEEIEMLKIYLDLEVMRFENTMQVQIDIDKELPLEHITLPPMLVQPYVENAIKHGLLHRKTDRKIQLKFNYSKDKMFLEIDITDNGVGRKISSEINNQRHKKHSSFSTFANQNRFDLLNQTLDKKITIQITDLYDNNQLAAGTNVKLIVPL